MVSSQFTLREMRPTDGPALVRLGEESPDTGRVGIHPFFPHDAYQTFLALHPNIIGVVAESPDYDGLVGNGLVRFSEGQFEGETRGLAYLSALHVHPHYRQQGMASALGQWRINAARQHIGEDGVIFAGIQSNNTGSQATARKWSNHSIQRSQSALVKMLTSPPPPLSGIEIRPARPDDYAEIARKQNRFFADYNLYEPSTADSLAASLAHKPFGLPMNNYYVAQDSSRNIVAGIGTIALGEFMPTRVTRMPLMLRIANLWMNVLPRDGIIKRILAVHFWFENDHPEAAGYLWESVRWLARDQGTGLMIFFDLAGPVLQTLTFPRSALQPPGAVVFQSPVPVTENRLIDMYQLSW